MAGQSAIEWTDVTWNPVTGCTKVSAGCDHCYAERIARRLLKETYRAALPVVDTAANRSNPFAVRIWPDRLDAPGKWREPRMIFVNSMSDLFHAEVPDEFIRRCFEVMLENDHHVYQVLTKRPGRAIRLVEKVVPELFEGGAIPGHIWIGTSVEAQDVDHRISQLLRIKATIRFLSCEPLLGPLDLAGFFPSQGRSGIHWVIAGGESGPNARPADPAWVRALRDQCLESGVPFFFKQWGGATAKAGGRELDGELWSQYPALLAEEDSAA
ncbi:MAG TPA: phage Gp37/Gp68 family protein [Longimicrobiales bacterium]|nr:phage Gp37/Gp68 family protein [Longimicrobiales bacterium]